jgi:hypothetical protein
MLQKTNKDNSIMQQETQRADQKSTEPLKIGKQLQYYSSESDDDMNTMKHAIVNRYGLKEFINGKEVEKS